MRKVFAILAISCLLLLSGGYHFIFRFRLASIKREMKKELQAVKKDEITRLVFSTGETESLHWENASEFRYRNEMYDVLKLEKENGQTIVWCISDQKENTLLEQFLKAHNQSSKKNSSGAILKLLTVQFIPSKENVLTAPSSFYQQAFPPFLCRIPYWKEAILVPPPKPFASLFI